MLRDEGGYPRVLRDQVAKLITFISECNLTSPVRAHLWSKGQQFSKVSQWRANNVVFIVLLCNSHVVAAGAPCAILVAVSQLIQQGFRVMVGMQM